MTNLFRTTKLMPNFGTRENVFVQDSPITKITSVCFYTS